MAAVRHFEFEKIWYFVRQPTLEAQSASACQISLKSDDFRLRYSDKTIFKMAAIRHLEFSKFGILVVRPVLERDSALSYKISL